MYNFVTHLFGPQGAPTPAAVPLPAPVAVHPLEHVVDTLQALQLSAPTPSLPTAAPSAHQLVEALANVEALAPAALHALWDELEAPARASDGRYAPEVQQQLAAWVRKHAAARAQALLQDEDSPLQARAAVAARLLDRSFVHEVAPLRAQLLELYDAPARARVAEVPASWAQTVQFLPMHKVPAHPATSHGSDLQVDATLRYLHDTTHDHYFRLSKHFTTGSFMKLRYGLDELGKLWAFRIGHLKDKQVRSGVGTLGEGFFWELDSMQRVHSPLLPKAIFAHTYGRIFCQVDPIACDMFDLRAAMDADPKLAKLAKPVLRQTVYRMLGDLAKLAAHDYGHFDIKPENVFLDLEGQGMLGDFGLAGPVGEVDHLRGTLGYLAPELLRAEHTRPTPKADLWSVGMFVWALLAPDALAATPWMQAREVEAVADALPGYAAWARDHLTATRFVPSNDPGPYSQAMQAATLADAKLSKLILPATLQVVPQARETAAALQAAMLGKFGAAYLEDPQAGIRLLARVRAKQGDPTAQAVAQLAQLSPRPQAAATLGQGQGGDLS